MIRDDVVVRGDWGGLIGEWRVLGGLSLIDRTLEVATRTVRRRYGVWPWMLDRLMNRWI